MMIISKRLDNKCIDVTKERKRQRFPWSLILIDYPDRIFVSYVFRKNLNTMMQSIIIIIAICYFNNSQFCSPLDNKEVYIYIFEYIFDSSIKITSFHTNLIEEQMFNVKRIDISSIFIRRFKRIMHLLVPFQCLVNVVFRYVSSFSISTENPRI